MTANNNTARKRAFLVLLAATTASLITPNIAVAKEKERMLHSFGSATDGIVPAGIARAADGTIYGTTEGGGTYGYGTIYKIAPRKSETVLYSFVACCTGNNPTSGPTLDDKGNLFGTTCCFNYGSGQGMVYELTKDGAYIVLHDFNTGNEIGEGAGVTVDKKGNIYGVTYGGGANGDGVAYEITPKGGYQVVHAFAGADGVGPAGRLLLDKSGNLFGTTWQGGQYGYGTIYEITPDGTETVLFSFQGQDDGNTPSGGVVSDKDGNFYGTASSGGANNYGVLFKFTPSSGALTVLHAFSYGTGDGWNPNSPPTVVTNGKGEAELYGVVLAGGSHNLGIAYKYSASGKYKIIYNFADNQSGAIYPEGPLVAGSGGKLYGVSNQGGGDGCIGYGCGVVYELH